MKIKFISKNEYLSMLYLINCQFNHVSNTKVKNLIIKREIYEETVKYFL